MNAFNLAQSAYGTSNTATRTQRGTEYDVFARVTRRLKSCAQQPGDFPALVQALHDNRRLWTIMAVDVADETNALPAPLRAQIFYLSEFTAEHTRKVLRDQASADALVDINTAVMRGLRSKGSVE